MVSSSSSFSESSSSSPDSLVIHTVNMVILEEQSTELIRGASGQASHSGSLDRLEKNRHYAASKVEAVYTVTRLVKELAGSSNDARQGYFVCLTELLRQAEVEYKTVAKQVQANLKIGGTLTKVEEADFPPTGLL